MEVVSEYRYKKLEAIDGGEGQNSLGVFRSLDQQFQVEVAVKEIAKADFRNPHEYFREAQQMFRSEHPNVVAIRTASANANCVCLSMPFFRHGSLGNRIERNGLAIDDVLRIGRQILAGVGAIHAVGTVHFDIKPSNVLFSDDNVAMVADFGQARDVGPHGVTLMPIKMYGPGIPPEAFINARRGTVESDIYQVGLTLWRTCNGNPIFEAQFAKHQPYLRQRIIDGKFPSRELFLPHVPARLRRVIRKALRVDPAERFPSAREFANALSKIEVRYNWRPESKPNDEMDWRGERNGAATILVTLRHSAGKCDVSLYTCTGGQERKTRRSMWRSGLTRKDAEQYLRELFVTLG